MCIGGSSSVSYAPKDTSGDPIKSAYELPPELVEQERAKAKNRAKSLVTFNDGDKGGGTGKGVTFSGPQPLGQPLGSSSGYGFNDASGGFKV